LPELHGRAASIGKVQSESPFGNIVLLGIGDVFCFSHSHANFGKA